MATKRDRALLALQKIDTDLDNLKNDLENMPEKAELTEVEAALAETKAQLEKVAGQSAGAEHDQKKREDESARLEAKIKNEEKKLYSGKVNNPKELMSLQQEIKVLSDEKDTVDTEYLIGLDEQAEVRKEESEIAKKLGEQEARLKELTGAIAKKTKELEKASAAAEENRKTPLKDIDEMAKKTYEQMRVKGHGLAVASATEGVCGGCHLENSEDSGHGDIDGPVRRCEYCHRILITI